MLSITITEIPGTEGHFAWNFKRDKEGELTKEGDFWQGVYFETANELSRIEAIEAAAKTILNVNKALASAGHTTLDYAGFVPGAIGIGADVLNALWYAAEGDFENYVLSAASAVAGSIPVKPVAEGVELVHSGSKIATQAQMKASRNSAQQITPPIKHERTGEMLETAPLTKQETKSAQRAQKKLIETKSPQKAGTEFHEAEGAAPKGADKGGEGYVVELKTHYTKDVRQSQLDAATKQSRGYAKIEADDGAVLYLIRIVKHYFLNPKVHGEGVRLKRLH